MKTTKNKKITCSFCGLSQKEVNLLIEGGTSYICNFCIIKSSDLLDETLDKNPDSEDFDIKAPALIKNELDSFIVDQEKAKKIVSVAVYNHYKRLSSLNQDSNIQIDKSNILLVGPTGTGKTLIAKTLAKVLNVPFVIVDATVLTEAGYVGEDVENILVRLYHEANYDIDKTQQGIIYIDEIDKIAKRDANVSITRDVSGEGVQQSLLKIIEGSIANIPPQGGRKHPEQPLVKIDTSNILFICGGTFAGLSKVIDRRIRGGGIGFDREITSRAINEDLLLNSLRIFYDNTYNADKLLSIINNETNSSLRSLVSRHGLAASCIKILLGKSSVLDIKLNDLKTDLVLVTPPIIIFKSLLTL